jgi:tetratricopeptide (TPR) repeat protein
LASTRQRLALIPLLVGCWLMLIVGSAMAAGDAPARPHAEADRLYLRGMYEEASDLYRKQPGEVSAEIGLARCLLARGKTSEAISLLLKASAEHEDSASLHAELSLLGLETGDLQLAEAESAAALKADPNCLPARWVAAELLRLSGKLIEAEKEYGWFIDRQRQLAGHFQGDAQSLHWIGLAGAQHARWTRNQRMFSTLVNDLYPSALKADENFWPAHLQSANLFLEKYNEPAALAAITAGLAINPNSADLHAARAAIAARSFDVAVANSSVARALDINPRHVWARQLAADIHLINTEPAKAVEALEELLLVRPWDEQSLGRLLGCYAALDGRTHNKPSERMQTIIEEASERNPHCGELFLAAGDALDRMRRFDQAADFYREAHRRMPQLMAAQSQLGMTLMRLGNEKEAATVLEAAFAVDPFNVRVKNTLEVLDLLQTYAVLETDHFVLKFDRGQDELLARYAAKHLEDEVYPQVVKTLGYEPKEKTLFEIFSRAKNTSGHGWFSARMVGVPAIGTVGACAGKMVAVTTPREIPKKFNWAKVLGHEFVHVVNLQQTDFNVPHWLTEGIAVHLEDEPRPGEWDQLLAKRYKAGTMFTLDNILFGFVRPQQKEDWTLAYCQAELFVDYALATHGDDALAKLLAAYGARLGTAEAIPQAFGVSQKEFEEGYGQFIAQIVSHLPSSSATAAKLEDLLAKAEQAPADANALAAVAVAYLDRDDKPRARHWADRAIKLQASHPAANYVLAKLQISIGDTEAAQKLLQRALDTDAPHEASLALLAAIELQQEDFDSAEKYFELGRQKFPHSDRWAKGLASIYLKQGAEDKLQEVLSELTAADPNSVPMRRKLAQLALAKQDFAGTRNWATQLIHLDVEDAEAHALLGQALSGLDKAEEAAEELVVAIELDGSNEDWTRLLKEVQQRIPAAAR